MNWYKKAQSREIWVDSKGQIAYIKGRPSKNRLNHWEFNEAKNMKSGTVTKGGITFVPPFKLAPSGTAVPLDPESYAKRRKRWDELV